MALKFLNKKGWHTGSLRNIERVWKAERTRDEEDRKLEELRKQISQEREKAEFRALQEQAGFQPRQERLDFLYESGLGVGKSTSEGFKELQAPPPPANASSDATAGSSKAAVPGSLFEDKPQSANDAWRKLHSDPLLLIRQREQEALARIKNNPIKMAMIKQSVEEEKQKEERKRKIGKKHKKHDHKSKKHRSSNQSESEEESESDMKKRKREDFSDEQRKESKHSRREHSRCSSDSDAEDRRKRCSKSSRHEDQSYKGQSDHRSGRPDGDAGRRYSSSDHHYGSHKHRRDSEAELAARSRDGRSEHSNIEKAEANQGARRRGGAQRMSEEERAARLREMQVNAEVHEEQRWTRVKKAAVADEQEVVKSNSYRGKNFLDEAQKSIYGAEKGGSATIEESVRRRVYYSQGGGDAHERNAFRR